MYVLRAVTKRNWIVIIRLQHRQNVDGCESFIAIVVFLQFSSGISPLTGVINNDFKFIFAVLLSVLIMGQY